MRVYHLWTTIELEDTDDDYFEEIDVPVSNDIPNSNRIKTLIHDGEKSDD